MMGAIAFILAALAMACFIAAGVLLAAAICKLPDGLDDLGPSKSQVCVVWAYRIGAAGGVMLLLAAVSGVIWFFCYR